MRATLAAGVLPSTKHQSEGLDDRIAHQEEGDRPNKGGNADVAGIMLLSGSAPAVVSSSQSVSGAPDEPRGCWCLFPVVGPSTAGCRWSAVMTQAECCSLLMMRRSTPRSNGSDA